MDKNPLFFVNVHGSKLQKYVLNSDNDGKSFAFIVSTKTNKHMIFDFKQSRFLDISKSVYDDYLKKYHVFEVISNNG